MEPSAYTWSRWHDWANLMLGAWLFSSAWLLPHAGGAASGNAWIVGVAIVLTSLWALARPGSTSAEAANIVLGAWAFFAPWLLGCATVTVASWNASVTGAAVALLAAAALTRTSATTPRKHA